MTNRTNEKEYIGLTLKEAEKLAIDNNDEIRIVREDGNWYVVTCEFHMDRVNVELNNGKVTATSRG